jgi:hypothetical protein
VVIGTETIRVDVTRGFASQVLLLERFLSVRMRSERVLGPVHERVMPRLVQMRELTQEIVVA